MSISCLLISPNGLPLPTFPLNFKEKEDILKELFQVSFSGEVLLQFSKKISTIKSSRGKKRRRKEIQSISFLVNGFLIVVLFLL